MPIPDLGDLRVLVTRPRHQAAAFIKKLHTAGAQTTEFPCIEIHYNRSLPFNDIAQLSKSDFLIFTSPNAVAGAIHSKLFDSPLFTVEGKSNPVTLGAIGQTTLKCLHDHQLKVELAPAENTDSEGFVAQFKQAIPPGSAITIVRGRHGRDALKQKLESLGAAVTYVSVYDQTLPKINEADARQILLTALPCAMHYPRFKHLNFSPLTDRTATATGNCEQTHTLIFFHI